MGSRVGSRVVVVGGGIAGLAAAWELRQHDVEVTLVEGGDRVGGKLRLAEVAGTGVDVGAESVLARRPEALSLITEVGRGADVVHPAAVGASIASGGRCWPMPRGTLMGVPSDPESVRGLLTDAEVARLVAEAVTPPVTTDVSVGDFIDARLGPAVTDKLVEPLLAGVYAGHARNLSLDLSVPQLARAARDGESVLGVARAVATAAAAAAAASGDDQPAPVFASVRGGLGSLPPTLAAALAARGVRIQLGTTARRLAVHGADLVLTTGPTTDERDEAFDAVVLATPSAPTSRLLATLAPDLAARLSRVEYASMAIVTIALEGPAPDVLDGSGFLVPPTEPLTIKASTFSSVKWPWLAAARPDRTFLRASIGRHREEATLQRSDDELVAVALADLATVLGRPLPAPLDTHVQRWGGGLPQYSVGHRALTDAAADTGPRLALAGAAYDGVGIPACIASGRRAAAKVLADLARRT